MNQAKSMPATTATERVAMTLSLVWTARRTSVDGNSEPLRIIRDVRRTALRTFRGVVSLREYIDIARHHEGGVKTHSKLPDDVACVLDGVLPETQDLALCYDADVLQDLTVSRTRSCALGRKGVSGLNDLMPIPSQSSSPSVTCKSRSFSRVLGAWEMISRKRTSWPVLKGLATTPRSSFYTATAAYVTRMRYFRGVPMDQSMVAATEWPTRFVATVG